MWWPANPSEWLSVPGLSSAWVAELGGVVVGHVSVVRPANDPVVAALAGVPSDALAMVSRLFVAPAGRGYGLGSALLGAAHDYAATQGLRLMLDVVDDARPAVALYERLGWRLVERRVADWTTPEGHRPPLRVYLST
jgi:GNAT superfamily N-acetyltransferase